MGQRSLTVIAYVATNAVLAACQQPQQPAIDLAAEEAVIRQRTKDWFAAEARHDMDASLSYLAPEAVVQAEGMPTISGSAGLRAMYEAQFKMPIADVRMGQRTVVVAPSGDLAYDLGPFTIVVAGDKPAEIGVKSTIIWRKQEGKWKAVVMTASTDAPPAAPAAAR